MSELNRWCAYINVVIPTTIVKNLLIYLSAIGINRLYSTFGRSVVLSESRGFSGLFKSSDLINEPVEVLHFYLPIEHEQVVMKSIVRLCRLDIPGRGSIFSKHIQNYNYNNKELQNLICDLHLEKLQTKDNHSEPALFTHLSQIFCTMSKGLADDVARLLLHLGVVPTITNAEGTGLRDKLGLLRITIPKEKELLSILVGHYEANAIMDRIIHWGKLDRPGRGFIWQVPIARGLINFKTSERSIGQAASTEQIIAAIDSIKGNFLWRQGGLSSLPTQTKRNYFKGIEFFMQVNEGDSLLISKNMIKFGISGATVQSLKTVSTENKEENIVIPQEIIRVVVTDDQAQKVFSFLQSPIGDDIEIDNDTDTKILKKSHIFGIDVNKAFNFGSS